MYMSSCVLVVPIVVSVPINTKCLSGVDTKVCIAAVGALATIVALVDLDLTQWWAQKKHNRFLIFTINN